MLGTLGVDEVILFSRFLFLPPVPALRAIAQRYPACSASIAKWVVCWEPGLGALRVAVPCLAAVPAHERLEERVYVLVEGAGLRWRHCPAGVRALFR